jgi:hypothetical protein
VLGGDAQVDLLREQETARIRAAITGLSTLSVRPR